MYDVIHHADIFADKLGTNKLATFLAKNKSVLRHIKPLSQNRANEENSSRELAGYYADPQVSYRFANT